MTLSGQPGARAKGMQYQTFIALAGQPQQQARLALRLSNAF